MPCLAQYLRRSFPRQFDLYLVRWACVLTSPVSEALLEHELMGELGKVNLR